MPLCAIRLTTSASSCSGRLTGSQHQQVYPSGASGERRIGHVDITGARWSVRGTEAILPLRSLRSSGDFDD